MHQDAHSNINHHFSNTGTIAKGARIKALSARICERNRCVVVQLDAGDVKRVADRGGYFLLLVKRGGIAGYYWQAGLPPTGHGEQKYGFPQYPSYHENVNSQEGKEPPFHDNSVLIVCFCLANPRKIKGYRGVNAHWLPLEIIGNTAKTGQKSEQTNHNQHKASLPMPIPGPAVALIATIRPSDRQGSLMVSKCVETPLCDISEDGFNNPWVQSVVQELNGGDLACGSCVA